MYIPVQVTAGPQIASAVTVTFVGDYMLSVALVESYGNMEMGRTEKGEKKKTKKRECIQDIFVQCGKRSLTMWSRSSTTSAVLWQQVLGNIHGFDVAIVPPYVPRQTFHLYQLKLEEHKGGRKFYFCDPMA